MWIWSRLFSWQMYSRISPPRMVNGPVVFGFHGDSGDDGPRLGVELGVVDRCFHFDVVEVGAGQPLGDLQLFAVRMAGSVQPSPIVKADGFDDQRVARPSELRNSPDMLDLRPQDSEVFFHPSRPDARREPLLRRRRGCDRASGRSAWDRVCTACGERPEAGRSLQDRPSLDPSVPAVPTAPWQRA